MWSNIFNNREIAYGFWLIVIAIYTLLNKKTRAAFAHLIKCASRKNIIILFISLASWLLLSVIFLYYINLWEFHQIKNTIYWFIFVGITSYNKLFKEDKVFFRNTIKDQFRIIVIIEFIVSIHTLGVLTEIILAPIIFSIAVMSEMASHKSKKDEIYIRVGVFFNYIIITIGGFIVAYAIYQFHLNWNAIIWEKNLYDLLIPILLSLMAMPFFYIIYVYMLYENAFARTKTTLKDENLSNYAKSKIMLRFNIRVSLLNKWRLPLKEVYSKKDIDSSIDKIYEIEQKRKSILSVDEKDGWLPDDAIKFLANDGLMGNYRKSIYDNTEKLFGSPNEFFGSSNALVLDSDNEINSIFYYLEGNACFVKKITLKMCKKMCKYGNNISVISHHKFLELAQRLHKKAIKLELYEELCKAILEGENKEMMIGENKIIISKDIWPNNSGYHMAFIICHLSHDS